MLPSGLRSFAFYVQAHAVYLEGDYARSLGIAETALLGMEDLYPIPAIYLHLVAVMDLMSLRRTDEAHVHLLEAWDLARPDDLIEGFGEHHGLLGGCAERTGDLCRRRSGDKRRLLDDGRQWKRHCVLRRRRTDGQLYPL